MGGSQPGRTRAGNHGKAVLRRAFVSFILEFWDFVKTRRKFWLIPILLIVATFGALLILTEGSALAPFVYTLF